MSRQAPHSEVETTVNTHEKASLIRLKVAALLKQVASLEQELAQLKEEKQRLLQEAEAQTKYTARLEETNKILKLADGIPSNRADRTEMQQALNRYIREVEECLKLLNQLPDNN